MPGEIAEMMLDGTMCESCGEFFDDGEAPGYPRRCVACHMSEPQPTGRRIGDIGRDKPIGCPDCKRRFMNEHGLRDHRRMKHGVTP